MVIMLFYFIICYKKRDKKCGDIQNIRKMRCYCYKNGQKNTGGQKEKSSLIAEFVHAEYYNEIIEKDIRKFRKRGTKNKIGNDYKTNAA